MTVHIVVSVKDRAIDAYGRPFIVPSIGAAIRSFTDEVNRKESEMHGHPEDYDLYQIGTYHDDTGIIYQNVLDGNENWAPKLLVRAQDVVISE
jgi:hypothetical protein